MVDIRPDSKTLFFMIGILISTYERYEPLAHWTAQQIRERWSNHPEIFFSGINKEEDCFLGYSGDPADWMGVTLEAVQKMRLRGFTQVYLILDDHPPVGTCHEDFLNDCLPSLAMQMNAVCIGLLGHGQHRKADGVILGKEKRFLEQCPPRDRWNFSLHPGLWNLEALESLLRQRMSIYQGKERTAWNFERHRDDPHDPVVGTMMDRCFRVSGHRFLKKKTSVFWQLQRSHLSRFVGDVMLYGAKKIGGSLRRDQLERKLLWLYGHYLGPYPLYWSGTMHKGKVHSGWERWLQSGGDRSLKKSWQLVRKNYS